MDSVELLWAYLVGEHKDMNINIETRQASQIVGKVWSGRNHKRNPQTTLQAEIRCFQIFVMYLEV